MLTINISEIKQGSSQIFRTVSPADFDLDGYADPVEIQMDINRMADNIYISMRAKTQLNAECDRCLEKTRQPIKENVRIVCTRDKQLGDHEDDVYLYGDTTDQIDLSFSLYQALILGIPQKILCRPDCRGLCAKCGTNLNKSTCQCKVEQIDPRWEALKKLKENKNRN